MTSASPEPHATIVLVATSASVGATVAIVLLVALL
jgi:hypothetical protein